ncbi:anion permease, partial [Acinetobacter baumannii]|uniref:anion permease n=1 Tax=Acinetobacter baumannii TaxID=470 RepID=UPI00208E74CB
SPRDVSRGGVLGAFSLTGGLLLPALVTAATILLWAAALLPDFLTALLFFTAAMVLHLAPADAVFSGFQSPAFWLVLSGFVLGVAIRKVGLAERGEVAGRWRRRE